MIRVDEENARTPHSCHFRCVVACELMDFGLPCLAKMDPLSSSAGEEFELRMKLLKNGRQSQINDLPGAVLTSIFGLVSCPRTRNCMSLACRDWYFLERQTRSYLALRGNLSKISALPLSFKNVKCLDLSCCSPWGYSIFQCREGAESIGLLLKEAFPDVKDLTVYVRDAVDIYMAVWLWPALVSLRLVRWHRRGNGLGLMSSELEPLLKCHKLRKLDLSSFYCWTEDILPALASGTAANLRSLNLLKISPEGFKTQELTAITAACKNLEELLVLCEFDPRLLDSVCDTTLELISINCPRLRLLHLVDNNEWGYRGVKSGDGASAENSNLTPHGLESMFKNLPHLEDLALLLAQNVWDCGPALEILFANCTKLFSLQLSHFHGVCAGPDVDGVARGTNLTELSIKSSLGFSDQSLLCISKGCRKLRKLSLKNCSKITEKGVNHCVVALSRTLIEVVICSCARLHALETLRALEPIRSSIRHLHVDCIWNEDVVARQAGLVFAGRKFGDGQDSASQIVRVGENDAHSRALHSFASGSGAGRSQADQIIEVSSELSVGRCLLQRSCNVRQASSYTDFMKEDEFAHQQPPDEKCWSSLQSVSLWISVGCLISPLPFMGLGRCPLLKDVSIKVEGDCKLLKRPAVWEWGLPILARYENLSKLNMDLGDMASFSLSAPEGQVDLSIWERHYLSGIDKLEKLRELDYKPPCDKHLNHRGLSLPAVAYLSQCLFIRKVIIHGSTHEHFLSMLLRNKSGLRDFQLRWDFFPAPENDTSTEVRIEACRRFEDALAVRGFPD